MFKLVSYWHVREYVRSSQRLPVFHTPKERTLRLTGGRRATVRNEPVFGLHSEKASIMPDDVFPLPRLIVTDADPTIDEAEVVKRENVGGPGKTCWFKNADELTEHPMICFAKGVSPDCRDYTLQALIHRMDNCIEHEIKASDAKIDPIEKKLSERDRKHHETKAIFLIDQKNSKKHSVGRTVFFVTVGQMKHFQIFLKTVLITPFYKSTNARSQKKSFCLH